MEYITLSILFIAFLVIALSVNSHKLDMMRGELNNVERKLEMLSRHMGMEDLSDDYKEGSLDDELRWVITQDNKIKAIKVLREKTGIGLKEAKDYVDKL